MGTIDLLGSDEQKARWLPPMARLEKIGAFGLTEPEHGSDSVALETTARRERDESFSTARSGGSATPRSPT
jgi:glutaryl-CoA dehydrogenase